MLASNCLENSAQVEDDGRRRRVTFRCLSPDAKLGAFFWDKERSFATKPCAPLLRPC